MLMLMEKMKNSIKIYYKVETKKNQEEANHKQNLDLLDSIIEN